MATRYLALIGPASSGATTAPDLAAASLTPAYASPRVRVYVDPQGATICADDGVAVGHLFTRDRPPKRVGNFTASLRKIGCDAATPSLVRNYWGGYVAFIETANGKIEVLRDPSGAMPCYYLTAGDLTVAGSDIYTLQRAGYLRPQVDWSFMVDFLSAYDLRSASTGFMGLKELPAGFRLTAGPIITTTPCWTPWEFTEAPRDRDMQSAAEALRQVVTDCTGAWASVFGRPLLSVSGGLDSSVLAAVLAGANTPAVYATMATEEATGDERRYARVLAAALRIDIREYFHCLSDIDVTRSTAAHLPRPVLYAFGQSERALKMRLAITEGVDAFFTGVGGDNVFSNMQSATPVVDRILAKGPGPGVLRTLSDVCRLTGCTYAQAIRMAWQTFRNRGLPYDWSGDTRFLNPDLLARHNKPAPHAWLSPPAGAVPGKIAHVAKLARIQGTTDGYSRVDAPPQINPLLSQPVMEFCLSVPTWQWIEDGRDRSVARTAFGAMLPSLLLNRRTKAGPDGFAFDVIDTNRQILRERLLDGELAAHGIVDRSALRAVLDDRHPIGALEYMRLSGLAEAEAWTRLW